MRGRNADQPAVQPRTRSPQASFANRSPGRKNERLRARQLRSPGPTVGSTEPRKTQTACDVSGMFCAGGFAGVIDWSAVATVTEAKGLDNEDHGGSSPRNGLSSAGNSKLAGVYPRPLPPRERWKISIRATEISLGFEHSQLPSNPVYKHILVS